MATPAKSLHQQFPRRFEVPTLLVLTVVLLIISLLLPFMRIDKFAFWEDDYTLLTSIRGMWKAEHYLLAAIIFFFSIVFPYAKMGMLGYLWYKPVESETRGKLLFWLGVLGKWSMLDVFVVALLIVLTQSKSFVDASPRAGLYVFAIAIVSSILVSIRVEWLAQRVEDQ
jgi:paraquat-inducible protein A